MNNLPNSTSIAGQNTSVSIPTPVSSSPQASTTSIAERTLYAAELAAKTGIVAAGTGTVFTAADAIRKEVGKQSTVKEKIADLYDKCIEDPGYTNEQAVFRGEAIGATEKMIVNVLKKARRLPEKATYRIEDSKLVETGIKVGNNQMIPAKETQPDSIKSLNQAQESLAKAKSSVEVISRQVDNNNKEAAKQASSYVIDQIDQAQSSLSEAQEDIVNSTQDVPESQVTSTVQKVIENQVAPVVVAEKEFSEILSTMKGQPVEGIPLPRPKSLKKRPRSPTGSISDSLLNLHQSKESHIGVKPDSPVLEETLTKKLNRVGSFAGLTLFFLYIYSSLRSYRLDKEKKRSEALTFNSRLVEVLYLYKIKEVNFLETKKILHNDFHFSESTILQIFENL